MTTEQTDGRALTVRDGTDLAPSFVVSGDVIAARIEELQKFVKSYMVENEDFGIIPGTEKPTLYKPGAEKLCDVYGFQRLFPPDGIHRLEDWDRGLFAYEVRCDLVSMRTGLIIAQGLGSANSKEERYRWRQQSRPCPTCKQETIIKGKAEYGGGWVCFKKKGGCGATFADDDEQITKQPVGRIENDEPFTLVNTLLKMAKKRALVDAVLSATRSSGIFTQDMEDLAGDEPAEKPSPARPAARQVPDPRAGWHPAAPGDAPNCDNVDGETGEPCNKLMVWKYGDKDGRKWSAWMCPDYNRTKHKSLFVDTEALPTDGPAEATQGAMLPPEPKSKAHR